MSSREAQVPNQEVLHAAGGMSLTRHHCAAGPHTRPFEEQHHAFTISLVERGVFSYRGRSGDGVLAPGWLLLGNQGEPYTCSHEHNDGSGDDCLVLGLSAEGLNSCLRLIDRSRSRYRKRGGNRFERACLPPLPRVAAGMRTLVDAACEGFARDEACLAVVTSVLDALTETGGGETAGDRQDEARRYRDWAQAGARYIESHAGEQTSLDVVAAAVGLSSFHFVRVFRRVLGVTPHQYLMRVRLLRAIALLRDTALPITQIAYDAGWMDLSNFIRTFRRELGCAPRDFRNARLPARPFPAAPAS